MPHTSSAAKRHRQDEKRRLRNRATMKGIKVQVKKYLAAVKDGNSEAVQTEFRTAVKRIDRAAAKRVIHPNAASRKKSQLAKKLPAAK